MPIDRLPLKERQALQKIEGVQATADYHARVEATRRTSERLRALRLARDPHSLGKKVPALKKSARSKASELGGQEKAPPKRGQVSKTGLIGRQELVGPDRLAAAARSD